MQGLRDFIIAGGTAVNIVLDFSAALAVLVFFWGLVVFLFKVGDEKSHEEGRNRMAYGIIALFVMVSIWGIVHFIQLDTGIDPVGSLPPIRNPIPRQICTNDPVFGRVCATTP